MSSRSTRNSILKLDNESKIFEAVKRRSELQDKIDVLTMNRKSGKLTKQQAEGLMAEFDSTAEILKKRKDEEEGEEETRPRSASSIEPRETRRSLRSQSIDKTVSTASTAKYESTDTSCTSSICGSPPKRRSRRRTLRSINENDNSNLDVTLVPTVESTPAIEATAQEDDKREEEIVETDNVDVNETIDNQQPTLDNDSEQSTATSNASSLMLAKYLESTLPDTKNTKTLRFSEPLQTPRNGQPIHSAIGNSSRRLSAATNTAGNVNNNSINKGKIRLQTSPEDSTRIFFESIGLTVMNFPQHLQASVKVQVSNLVHELEYKLSSPIDKTTAVAS